MASRHRYHQPAQRTQLLERALGVTRVARVSGLDRCGVEVACAMRPTGHVLQVSNGKGHSFAAARASALGEAAELWAAEQAEPSRWTTAAQAELDGPVWGPEALGGDSGWWPDSARLAWVKAASARGPVWVPAQAVWCLPGGAVSTGPERVGWTSNGLAAHPDRARAVEHALCEVLERHALPDEWSVGLVRRTRVACGSALVTQLQAKGFAVGVFDLTGRSPWPVAGAVLVDLEQGPVPLTAGYACRRTLGAAADAALLEAAQSRLTEVQGAREDVALGRAVDARQWERWLRIAPPRDISTPRARSLPEHAVVELVPGRLPVRVVKVLVPGARVSRLLQ